MKCSYQQKLIQSKSEHAFNLQALSLSTLEQNRLQQKLEAVETVSKWLQVHSARERLQREVLQRQSAFDMALLMKIRNS
eukprot:UN24962